MNEPTTPCAPVLADDEIAAAVRPLYGSDRAADMGRLMDLETGRKIEAAVLAKLSTQPPQPDRAVMQQALDALEDITAGWVYIRQFHGELYGVGWDRAQGKADAAMASLRAALSATKEIP